MNVKKIDEGNGNKIKCDGCDKDFEIKDMVEKEECLLCPSCYKDLHDLMGTPDQPKTNEQKGGESEADYTP